MEEPKMPSKVIDKKFIQMPEGNVVDSDEEWDRCGKWMLHHPYADLGFLDSAWTALQHLLDDGTLIMLKATTALVVEEGVSIYCFTRPGKQEAKRAATAISTLVDFRGLMYYKLNKQTSQGLGNRNGDGRHSMYMHTYRGRFYTKKHGCWIKDNEDATGNIVPIASKFFKENNTPGVVNLPTTCEGRCYWKIPEEHQCKENKRAYWFMICDCEDDGPYLSEPVRVWQVAKELLEEGLFAGITLRKTENWRFAEVQFYISHPCDVHSHLTTCDRIFKEASVRYIMYFAEASSQARDSGEVGNRFPYAYKYTSDGELYRRTEYAEEYVFV